MEIIEINDDMAIIKVRTQIDKHFNFSLLGVQVLSMSKRIMNEMMTLGFDIGAKIYYQDTDSIMIEADDLPRLEEAFEKKYNRPLKGKALGQFHNDFPTINGHDEVPHSIEAYFIMKKVYIHRITDSTGDIDYVIRGKGLTQQSIKYAAGRKGVFMKLYRALFKGKEVSFDLCDGQPSFDMRNDFTVSTRKKFERRIKTNYKLGKSDKYFEYANN